MPIPGFSSQGLVSLLAPPAGGGGGESESAKKRRLALLLASELQPSRSASQIAGRTPPRPLPAQRGQAFSGPGATFSGPGIGGTEGFDFQSRNPRPLSSPDASRPISLEQLRGLGQPPQRPQARPSPGGLSPDEVAARQRILEDERRREEEEEEEEEERRRNGGEF
jgi:hypothetical protein